MRAKSADLALMFQWEGLAGVEKKNTHRHTHTDTHTQIHTHVSYARY